MFAESPRCGSIPYLCIRLPRAVTATRPLPGAKIETCRSAAAWRSAPFLLLLDLMGIRVAAIRLCPPYLCIRLPRAVTATRPLPGAKIGTCRCRGCLALRAFFCGRFDGGLGAPRFFSCVSCEGSDGGEGGAFEGAVEVEGVDVGHGGDVVEHGLYFAVGRGGFDVVLFREFGQQQA